MRWRFSMVAMTILWLVSLGLVSPGLVWSAARGADADGQFAVKGAGSLTCAELTSVIEKEPKNTFLVAGWLDGYLTAVNQFADGVVDHAPWQSVELLLDVLVNHCGANPEEPVVRATQIVLGAMRATRLTKKVEIETIQVGDQGSFQIDRESLRRAQQQLISLGHLDGGADGRFGPKTAAAFGEFQAASQLPVTNVPDQLTLFRLFEALFNAR